MIARETGWDEHDGEQEEIRHQAATHLQQAERERGEDHEPGRGMLPASAEECADQGPGGEHRREKSERARAAVEHHLVDERERDLEVEAERADYPDQHDRQEQLRPLPHIGEALPDAAPLARHAAERAGARRAAS